MIVCDESNSQCMLRNCSDCPEELENLLKNMLKDNQHLTYKEWIFIQFLIYNEKSFY